MYVTQFAGIEERFKNWLWDQEILPLGVYLHFET